MTGDVNLEGVVSDSLQEAIEILGLPPVGRLARSQNGTYENLVNGQIQWVVTLDSEELIDLRLAKHGFAHTNQGCLRSLIDLVRTSVGLPSILNYPVYFLEPALSGPLKKGEWPEIRDEAARVRAKVTQWAEGMAFSAEQFQLQRVKAKTWVARRSTEWEVVVDASDYSIRHNPEITPGSRLWSLL